LKSSLFFKKEIEILFMNRAAMQLSTFAEFAEEMERAKRLLIRLPSSLKAQIHQEKT
jgi:hypothetical protein